MTAFAVLACNTAAVLCCAVLCHAVLGHAVLGHSCAVLGHAVLGHAVLCRAVLCCAGPCWAMLCHAGPCCAVLGHAVLCENITRTVGKQAWLLYTDARTQACMEAIGQALHASQRQYMLNGVRGVQSKTHGVCTVFSDAT